MIKKKDEEKKSPDRKNHIVNAIPSDKTWIGSRKKKSGTAFLARTSWQQRIEEAIFSRQTPRLKQRRLRWKKEKP